jgi:hypothetical protein
MTRTIQLFALFALLLWSTLPSYAHNWEFGMKVIRDSQAVALTVYLYEPNNLNLPIRLGTSVSGYEEDVNFRCDIEDAGYTQEPNCGNTQWVYIKPGAYILRVDNKWAPLTIHPMEDSLNRDFTILNDEGGFKRVEGDRYYLGETETWSSAATAEITIDQKLSSNSTAGKIYHVFTNGFEIWTNGTNTTFPVNQSSAIALRADRLILSGEKYNNWNSLNEVTNHKAFQVTTVPASIISYFASMVTNATITAGFVDLPSVTPDSIAFKDPWFVDYADGNYGDLLRNRGMDAPYKMRSCPFAPDANTVFDGVSAYQGVFLSQYYGGSSPYYSIAAPPPQLMNDISSFLLNWSGSGVAFQDATACSTGVVFTSANCTATANYKLHLGSSVSSASGYNNQRKIGYVNNAHRMVYESAGEVWFCSSTDDGANWTPEIRLTGGAGHARQPSLAIQHQYAYGDEQLGVVWEDYDGSSSTICVRRLECNRGNLQQLPKHWFHRGFAGDDQGG